MIWLSLLDYLKRNNVKGEVVFIQANATDFFENNTIDFYQDLQKDVQDHSLKCQFHNYKPLNAFLKERVVEEDHRHNYDSIQQDYLDKYDYKIEEQLVEHLNVISAADFINLIIVNNPWFPNLPVISSHKFEIMEVMEDPMIFGCKTTALDTLSINYSFELRICVLSFTHI